ncbi:MAG: GDSL-type esterase/lipase family protein [Acutalibacteraceae bacterium]
MKKLISVLLALVMLISLSVPAFAAEEKLNFLSLGDSIAAGAGLLMPSRQAYGAIVSNTNGYNFKNDAVSGHTTQNMLRRINEKRVADDIKNADIICISIGGNNFLHDNVVAILFESVVKKDFSRFDDIIEKYYEDLGTIMDYIKSLNPDAVILMQTLYNPMYISDELREVYREGTDRINGTIRRYLRDNEGVYTIVDVAEAFGDNEALITADYIHPNSKGHVVIAGEVLKTLKQLGLGENTEPVYREFKLSTLFDEILYKIRTVLNAIKALSAKA